MLRGLVLASAVLAVPGCKLAVIVTEAGDVQSLSGTRDCAGGSVCEINVTDTTFTESFTAVPRPGYEFAYWLDGGGAFFCGNSTNPTCVVSNVGGAGNAAIEAVVASEAYFYIMPVFEYAGIDTDLDGIPDHLDDDDDGDGLLDGVDPCPLDPDPLCGPAVVEQLVNTACWTVFADIGNAVAQTFTASATGNLTEVGFAIQGDGFATNLVILEGDINGSAVHLQAVATPAITGTPAGIEPYLLDNPVPVTSGQQYTISLVDSGGFGLRFCGASTNPYAGGNVWQVEYFLETEFPGDDAAFSVTIHP